MEHGENLPSNALFSVDNFAARIRRLTLTLFAHVHDARDAYASLIAGPRRDTLAKQGDKGSESMR